MFYLILCHPDDEVAVALYSRLVQQHANTLLVTSTDLILAKLWVQKIDEHGKCITTIVLQNGITISSDKLIRVFNRIRVLQMQHFINTVDRAYAEMEFYALYVSFLKNISPVLFEPFTTVDINFQVISNNFYLFNKAIECGLNVVDFHFTSAPAWKNSPQLQPFGADTKEFVSGEAAQHLLWQNMPVIFAEPHEKTYKIVVAGNKAFGCVTAYLPKERILAYSKALNKRFIELNFAETQNGLKLFSLEIFPAKAEPEVIDALAAELQ